MTLHGRRRVRSPSPMSEEGSKDCRSKKRPRASAAKLRPGEVVEVRRLQEGFLGSWHLCTVLDSEKGRRYVRYEKVLHPSGKENLAEVVIVSKALEGQMGYSDIYRRGRIRPQPPLIQFEKRNLEFGMCVDVCRQDAWWEGVIFDHCDGMEDRSVFFPDSGDEKRVGVDQLRITHDWDEVTEKWAQRGKWVLLELIEECERESYVAASPKQIWHDVRGRMDFGRIGEWTFNVRDSLRDMVKEIVNGYWKLTVNETQQHMESVEKENSELTEFFMCVEKEIYELKESVHPPPVIESVLPPPVKESVLPPPVEEDLPETSFCGAGEVDSGAICTSWKPLKLSEIEFCPVAVEQYVLAKNEETRELLTNDVRKHLAYLGWEIEWAEEKSGSKRYKYISPDKLEQKVYLSLVELCKDMLLNDSNLNAMQLPQNDPSTMHDPAPESDQAPPSSPPEAISPGVARRVELLEKNVLNLQQMMEQRFQSLQELLLARLPIPQASSLPPQ